MQAKVFGRRAAIFVTIVGLATVARAGYVDTLTGMSGLVSYWNLNEAAGSSTAADLVTGDAIDGNNAGYYLGSGITVGDAGPRPEDGWTGFAADNRAPTFTKLPDAKLEMFNPGGYGGLTDATLLGWFRITDPDGGVLHNMIGGLQNTGSGRYIFATNNYPSGMKGFVKRSDDSQMGFGNEYVANASDWHFLALTYEGGAAGRLYIDGVQRATATNETALGLAAPVAMVFGADVDDATRALHGQLDELATFNRALSPTEIENLFTTAGGQLPGPPPNPGETATAPYLDTLQNLGGLRNHWGMEETSGTTAADMVAGNNGTYTNLSGDPVALGQAGPGSADGFVGFDSGNKSAQFVWNAGGNQLEAQDGQVVGSPGTGTAFEDGVSELTMSLWFKNNYNGDGYIAGFAHDDATRYIFSMTSPTGTSVNCYVKSDNGEQIIKGGLAIDDSIEDWSWHHLVQVWDGAEKRFTVYLDGEEAWSGTNSMMSENLALPDGFYIGRDVPGATRNLGGFVDEVSLFGRALTGEEVFELYDSAFFSASLLAGDLNGDGFVGGDDLDIVRSFWGQSVAAGDLESGDPSGDGFVGGDDLDIVRANWGQGTPPAPTAVPEPTMLVLLLSSVVATLLARRRYRSA